MLQIYNLFSKTPSNRRFSYIPVFPKEFLFSASKFGCFGNNIYFCKRYVVESATKFWRNTHKIFNQIKL